MGSRYHGSVGTLRGRTRATPSCLELENLRSPRGVPWILVSSFEPRGHRSTLIGLCPGSDEIDVQGPLGKSLRRCLRNRSTQYPCRTTPGNIGKDANWWKERLHTEGLFSCVVDIVTEFVAEYWWSLSESFGGGRTKRAHVERMDHRRQAPIASPGRSRHLKSGKSLQA
jgi:hypothetical protein